MNSKIKIGLFIIIFLSFAAIQVDNPAPGLFTEFFGTDFRTIITTILRLVLGLAGLIAVGFVILGGYEIATAAGNEDRAKNGRKTLTNAIIGLVIVILSFVIVNVIVNASFGNVGGGGGGSNTPNPPGTISL